MSRKPTLTVVPPPKPDMAQISDPSDAGDGWIDLALGKADAVDDARRDSPLDWLAAGLRRAGALLPTRTGAWRLGLIVASVATACAIGFGVAALLDALNLGFAA